MKKCQVLVSCMNEHDFSIIDRMHINSAAIIVNQTDFYKIDVFDYNSNSITFLSLNERGVGLSRNTALMRASSDYIIFADEDEILSDNYETIVENEFQNNKSADVILFNVTSLNPDRPQYFIKKKKRVNRFNCSKYGAVRIAAKRESIFDNNIYFSLLFGGGAKFSNGEDSLFIMDCIRNGLKVFTSPKVIGSVAQDGSSWFSGYSKKYFVDRAVLYKKLYRGFSFLFTIKFLIRIHKYYKNDLSFFEALKYMLFYKRYLK